MKLGCPNLNSAHSSLENRSVGWT